MRRYPAVVIFFLALFVLGCDPWRDLDLVEGTIDEHVAALVDAGFETEDGYPDDDFDTRRYMLSVLDIAIEERNASPADGETTDRLWTGAGLEEYRGIKASAILAYTLDFTFEQALCDEVFAPPSGSTKHRNERFYLDARGDYQTTRAGFFDALMSRALPRWYTSVPEAETVPFMVRSNAKIEDVIDFKFPMTKYVDTYRVELEPKHAAQLFDDHPDSTDVAVVLMYLSRAKNDKSDKKTFASFKDLINVNFFFGAMDEGGRFMDIPGFGAKTIVVAASYVKAGGAGQKADPKNVLSGLKKTSKKRQQLRSKQCEGL